MYIIVVRHLRTVLHEIFTSECLTQKHTSCLFLEYKITQKHMAEHEYHTTASIVEYAVCPPAHSTVNWGELYMTWIQ
jgi:hypothetical protein